MSERPVVAVLDHGMGNLRSVSKALEAAGAAAVVTRDRRTVEEADALCVPGQGILGRCVDVMERGGFDDLVRSWIATERPFLGICLGMQILFTASEEDDAPGLGIFQGRIERLPEAVRVPHIGWNEVDDGGSGSFEKGYFYFDHSYAAFPEDSSIVSGWCEHGRRFAAAIEARSLLAVQFHPEKSGRTGLGLLRRWVGKVAGADVRTMEKHS